MKNITVALLLVLVISSHSAAQTSNGSLTGAVRDSSGAVVPGASITAQGSDATFQFTTELDGAFRFLNLEPDTYRLTASLSGFRADSREVIVSLGKNTNIDLRLEVSSVDFVVTVASPIVDAKQTGTATTFSKDELVNVPTSRDPFALVRTVPGVLLDRVN